MKVDKNKKLKIGILIAIPVFFILMFLIFFLSLVKDKNDSKEAMKTIRKDYDPFTNQVVEFNNYRDKIYDEIFSDSYYESFKTKNESFENTFKEYEKLVDKIVKQSKHLISYCDGIYYTDRDVNTMCNTFSRDYETLYNSFVVDVNNYKILVKEYNTYIDENKLEDTKLKEYKTTKKFIDYNKDKKYSGKE